VSTAAAGPTSTRVALGCSVLFLLPFAAGGLFAAAKAVAAVRAGDWGQAGLLTIFALVFGGVGIGGITAVLAGRRKAEAALIRERLQPDAPWLWREDWAARRLTDSSRGGMWGAWVFAALWNLISIPSAVLGVRAALREGNRAALVALIFPVVGIGFIVWAVRATLRYRTFGVSRLDLATLPAPVGHTLEGTVRTPAGLRPADGFRLKLSCVRRVTTGSGRNRSTSESLLWQEERRVSATADGVPVAFAIPADAVPSDARRSGDRTLWRLEISAEVPGIDYASAFEVPVFRTAASGQPRSAEEQSVAAAFAVPADYRQPQGSRIQVSTNRRGTEIFYPRARNPGMAIGITAFTALWGVAVWAGIAFGAPLIFPIVFGAFGLLLVVAVLDAWLGVTRVTVGDGTVTVASGWLTPGRSRTLRAGEISDVTTKAAGQAGRTMYYDVVLVTNGGKRVAAGRGVREKREAEWLAATVRGSIGLGQRPAQSS
jgi:hypothetical protein